LQIPFLPFTALLTAVSLTAAGVCPASAEDVQEKIQDSIELDAAKEREQGNVEDPLSSRQSEKTNNPDLQTIKPNSFSLYTSLRFRYRQTSDESIFADGGTRAGINGEYQIFPTYWVLGRGEMGFKLFDNIDQIFDPSGQGNERNGEDIFLRLGYVGLETPSTFLTFGKNWSTYYQVASFTDRFQGTGASASGTFNAGTDGGPSGTGRADNVFQTRLQIKNPRGLFSFYKPFNLNLQFQAGEKIPFARSARYKYSTGFSAILERWDNLKGGIAVNYAPIYSENLPLLEDIGIQGDDISVLLGFQWFGKKWYAATVISRLDNHMATQDGIYFSAWGSEGYAHYHVGDKIWLVGGWNYLEPQHGEEQAGSYVLRYAVLGLRYTFKDFQRMIYANIRFDSSRLNSDNNEELSNVYTIGVRWDFDW
jgi:predicted porin